MRIIHNQNSTQEERSKALDRWTIDITDNEQSNPEVRALAASRTINNTRSSQEARERAAQTLKAMFGITTQHSAHPPTSSRAPLGAEMGR
jgi:hypothetical protein